MYTARRECAADGIRGWGFGIRGGVALEAGLEPGDPRGVTPNAGGVEAEFPDPAPLAGLEPGDPRRVALPITEAR